MLETTIVLSASDSDSTSIHASTNTANYTSNLYNLFDDSDETLATMDLPSSVTNRHGIVSDQIDLTEDDENDDDLQLNSYANRVFTSLNANSATASSLNTLPSPRMTNMFESSTATASSAIASSHVPGVDVIVDTDEENEEDDDVEFRLPAKMARYDTASSNTVTNVATTSAGAEKRKLNESAGEEEVRAFLYVA